MGIFSTIFGGGGPSSEQESIAKSQSSFASELANDYATMFNFDSSVLSDLRTASSSLVAAGPNQHGYNSAVLNALNTQLINSNAAGYRNSVAAVRNFMAGQGGGAASGVTSGIAAQIQGDIAAQASNALTAGQTNVMMKDYDIGRQNWLTGLQTETSLAGLAGKQAESLGSSTIGAQEGAYKSAKNVQDEKNAARGSIMGAIAGLAGPVIGAFTGGIGALGAGESFGEGFKDFMSGMGGGTGAPPPGGGGNGDFGGET